MTEKKKKTAAATAIVALSLVFAGSFAWLSTLQTATNKFTTPEDNYAVKLHDKFGGVEVGDGETREVNWKPGNTVDKDVWVTNTGESDVIVRVKLTENLTVNKNGGLEIIGNKYAVHKWTKTAAPATYGKDCSAIHDMVTWQTGTVKTYNEWYAETDTSKRTGAFWVMANDGWAYWMQPLAPTTTSTSAAPDAVGNTGKLLDSVTLKSGIKGHIDYRIKVEMDAIDASLVGLNQDGMTWEGDQAIILARTVAAHTQIAQLLNDQNAATCTGAKTLYEQALIYARIGQPDRTTYYEAEAKELETTYKALSTAEKAEWDAAAITLTGDTLGGSMYSQFDPVLAKYLARQYGTKTGDNYSVTKSQLKGITGISTNSANFTEKTSLKSLKGVTSENFPYLELLNLSGIKEFPVNQIAGLDSHIKNHMEALWLQNMDLQGTLDVSDFANLRRLVIDHNPGLTELRGPAGVSLISLLNTNITVFDASRYNHLYTLNVGTSVEKINGIEQLTKLEELTIVGNQKLHTLNLSHCHNLTILDMRNSMISEIMLSDSAFTKSTADVHGESGGNVEASRLSVVGNNGLTTLDISKMKSIKSIDLNNTNITTVTKRKDQEIINASASVTVKNVD